MMMLGNDVYFVMAGDVFVNRTPRYIKTVLGSCVALVAWLPKEKLGGMCHYLLSGNHVNHRQRNPNMLGCFALNNIKSQLLMFAPLEKYEFHLVGGGSLMHKEFQARSVSSENIQFALDWLDENQIRLTSTHLGGTDCRAINLDLHTGELKVKTYNQHAAGLSKAS